MRRQDFRQPDLWQHLKKTLRRYWQDLRQRLQRVDIRAMAADWAVTGVDMSYWQGEIKDPEKLAGMVDFVILRAGYGNDFIDPRLEDYGVSSRYIDQVRYNGTEAQFFAEFGIDPPTPPTPPQEQDMRYRANVKVKIRSTPEYDPEDTNLVGYREVGEIVIPVDTIGDSVRAKSYWVKDAKGWSAAQWLGVEYMEPFV